jgi:hypothetical protein
VSDFNPFVGNADYTDQLVALFEAAKSVASHEPYTGAAWNAEAEACKAWAALIAAMREDAAVTP